MAHFYLKLLPPRATFATDMTTEERAMMGQHAAYVRKYFESGEVLAYGPVLAVSGSFGVGLLNFESEAAARKFADADPTVLSGLNRYELHPMMIAGSQSAR